MAYETILVETRGKVGLITINRPKGAQCAEQPGALRAARRHASVRGRCEDRRDGVDRIGKGLRGRRRHQGDAGQDLCRNVSADFFTGWEAFARVRKPIIAAVSGYALGGGCELAMMCDFIIAAETAKFGQPEITLGVIPGMGGSQRLTRFVGKSKAMDMCLTGRMMDAAEAERCGLVSRVVPAGELLDEAMKAAAKIADFSLPATMMAKEAVNRAFETTLGEGLRFERRLFHSLFAFEDQKEGMAAFAEKRTPNFQNR